MNKANPLEGFQFDLFEPTRAAALARLAAVRPHDYARSRNALEGAVSYLSPYITHGLVSLPEVLKAVTDQHPLDARHKFVFELGWREYFRHVWAFRGEGILKSLHQGLLPDADYAANLPADIRQAATGIPVIDMAVRTLYATAYLHNHARMWLASYIVHVRKVHWRVAADWLYGHLLDGDLASNHLSWQWVAGTGSHKPYLFNADNVARYAPVCWHSPGTVLDQSYEALDALARQHPRADTALHALPNADNAVLEPPLTPTPAAQLGWGLPNAAAVDGRDVWLVHPWNMGAQPTHLAANTVVVGVLVTDFHSQWPWSERRWAFVTQRMSALVTQRWQGSANSLATALQGASSVRSIDDPHLSPWLNKVAHCTPAPALFPAVHRQCDSFSQWWTRATRGVGLATDFLSMR